ncbi:MAG: prolipoprotein diacylglyceryl transferase [Pirellulaceae bacterium]
MYWRALQPILILVGLAISYWALKKRTATSPLSTEQKSAVGLAAFIGAALGAKLPFLFTGDPSLGSWIWLSDGKTILGGICGGYVAVELAKRAVGIQVRTGDNFAVPVAVAIAAGRLGCFAGGCCFGEVTMLPIGVHFPLSGDAVGTLRHPAQLYEFIFHVTAIAWLLPAERYQWWSGRRLTIYLTSYLIYRFVSEWIRPEPHILLGLTAYQLAAAVMLACLLFFEISQSNGGQEDKLQATRRPTSENIKAQTENQANGDFKS